MIRRLFLSTFVLAASQLTAAPAVPLVNLVDEQTLFAVSVTDAPALLRGWDANPIATTWRDPEIVRFLAPLRAELEVDEWDAKTRKATGFTVRELLAMAEGQALLALPSFDFVSHDWDEPPPFLVAIEVGEQQGKIEKILADTLAEENLREEIETFAGVQVHVRPLEAVDREAAESDESPATPSVTWAMTDGVWLISADKQRVFSAIDAVAQGGLDNALGKSERFLRTRNRSEHAQALVYGNLPALYPLLRDAVTISKARAAGTLGALGMDPEVVFNALGLDALGESYVAVTMDEKRTRIDAGLLYSEERGVLKLAAYQPGAPVLPEWIPAKWPSVSTARFSLAKAYAGFEQLFSAVSPMLSGVMQMRIRELNKRMNIDLHRDLVGSVGDEVVSAYGIPPGGEAGRDSSWVEMDQLVSFALVNEPAFIKSLDALKSLAGPGVAEQMFNTRDYLGHTVYSLNLPPAAPGGKPLRGVTYAIANRTFLLSIGSTAMVEAALQGMESGRGGFWERDDVKTALAELPSEAMAVQVQDLRVILAAVVEMAVQLQKQDGLSVMDPSSGEKPSRYLDVSARPDEEVIGRHWGLATGYSVRTADGLFSTSFLAHP